MKFTFFWGANNQHGWFSQWYPLGFKDLDGVEYNCAEQYMMAEKARLFGDTDAEKLIMEATSPSRQKKLGRGVRGFSPSKWNASAKQIVYRGNYFKFTQNPDFLTKLMETTGELVEASPYDKVWGIGLPASSPRAQDKSTWQGKNWLGEVLTQLRRDLSQSAGD